jgi:hypothetical protein
MPGISIKALTASSLKAFCMILPPCEKYTSIPVPDGEQLENRYGFAAGRPVEKIGRPAADEKAAPDESGVSLI